MEIEETLYKTVVALIEQRYPSGDGVAVAMKTDKGNILTSVSPDTKNDALSLCAEVGASLEAHKLNEKITHSLCVCREDDKIIVLSPCGICSERLAH